MARRDREREQRLSRRKQRVLERARSRKRRRLVIGGSAVVVLAVVVLIGWFAYRSLTLPQGPLSVGNRAPSFTLPSANGGEVSLADFLGRKHILLYFSMADG